MSGTKAYDKLLEKATSPLLLEVDWDCILRMCDLIRQGDVQAKYAVAQIRKKMTNENVNTVIFSLQCLESIVKNCGSKVHQEIATRDFMDGMRAIALAKSDPIKAKILELIQCWGHAFKKNPNYKIVEDYFNSMKLEGFQFPVLKESEAMFDVEEAPAWKEDSECQSCFRCRSDFSTLRRRHHCRACGQIFCHACSSKTAAIPKYGIEKEVRVCDLCFEKLKINPTATSGGSDQLPIEYLNSALFKDATKTTASAAATSVQPKKPAEKTEQEFEEELQLALALSQSEAEAAEMKKKKTTSSSITNGTKSANASASATQNNTNNTNKLYPSNLSQFKDDSNKNESPFKQSKTKQSWQQDSRSASFNESSASVNNGASAPFMENVVKSPTIVKIANDKQTSNSSSYSDEELRINNEIDEFVDELKKILELYINRMKSDSLRGRSITNDTAVQSLFLQLQQMHPKLLSFIKYQEDARGYYENLQDKLTQLKDAREALNALRHENFEKKKRENEERERLRQVQIAQKLQHMRQQKQSYYQYQNQLNLQRLHLQERDLQMRLEQQRQLVIKRDQQLSNGLPFPNMMSNENFNPGMMNQQQMPYSPQQISMMNNSGMMNPAAMNGGNMYPQYLDQYQMQNSSMPPQSNSLPNGHTNGLQMVDNNNIHSYQLNSIQQQSQPQAIYLQQQQNPQQTLQYQQQLAQMPLNNQQTSQLPPPTQQQQQQQPPLVYSQPQAQIQLPNQQLQYQQYQQQMQQQHQQATISNIINEAKENTIKEAQLISFD